MRIALIGAFDRNNLGDLLMPMVFEQQYKQQYGGQVSFEHYALTKQDMEELRSFDAIPLSEMHNCDIAIVVGGETIEANYTTMLMNLQKNSLLIFANKVGKKIFPNILEKIARNILHGRAVMPWVIDKETYHVSTVIYNTIGGCVNNIDKDKQLHYKEADYISVRNESDYEFMHKINKQTFLYPDSVVAISDIFSNDVIIKNVRSKIVEKCKSNYFIIQINKYIAQHEPAFDLLCQQILVVCKKENIKCFLLPIGYAEGHEDQIPLHEIYKKCKCKNVELFNKLNIYESLYVLQNARAFVGTSLHGNVISDSYNIPHIFLTSNVSKGIKYMQTWDKNVFPFLYCDYNNLAERTIILLDDDNIKARLKENTISQKKLAKENFTKINDIINRRLKR